MGKGFHAIVHGSSQVDLREQALPLLVWSLRTTPYSIISKPTCYTFGHTHASLLAPTYPPSPIEIAPATSSARLPRTTILLSPNADRPALSANGTVKPSERPRIASEMTRGFIRDDSGSDSFCDSACSRSRQHVEAHEQVRDGGRLFSTDPYGYWALSTMPNGEFSIVPYFARQRCPCSGESNVDAEGISFTPIL